MAFDIVFPKEEKGKCMDSIGKQPTLPPRFSWRPVHEVKLMLFTKKSSIS